MQAAIQVHHPQCQILQQLWPVLPGPPPLRPSPAYALRLELWPFLPLSHHPDHGPPLCQRACPTLAPQQAHAASRSCPAAAQGLLWVQALPHEAQVPHRPASENHHPLSARDLRDRPPGVEGGSDDAHADCVTVVLPLQPCPDTSPSAMVE